MESRAVTLKAGFDIAHFVFNSVVADLDEAAAAHRTGNVPSSAAICAHALFGEDMMFADAFAQDMLIKSNDWRDVTGITIDSPSMSSEWLALSLKVAGLKRYAEAVFARTDAFITSATPAAFDRMIRTPMGQEASVAAYLNSFGLVHISQHTGEISALKGAQGLRGLPF